MHSIFVLGPFVKINLWVGTPGGHSFQVPMFLNGKKVQSETWRDGRKMVCSRIGECKEIKIGWSAESCGVQSFRRLNSWPIPMSPCQICQCVTKVVSWTPLDHQGKQHLLWCAQSRHWRLGSTKYIADVCSLRILRLRFFRKSEKAPKAPLLLQILHQPQLSSLDGTRFCRYQVKWLPGRRSVRQASDPVSRSLTSLAATRWVGDGEMIKQFLVNILLDIASRCLQYWMTFGYAFVLQGVTCC